MLPPNTETVLQTTFLTTSTHFLGTCKPQLSKHMSFLQIHHTINHHSSTPSPWAIGMSLKITLWVLNSNNWHKVNCGRWQIDFLIVEWDSKFVLWFFIASLIFVHPLSCWHNISVRIGSCNELSIGNQMLPFTGMFILFTSGGDTISHQSEQHAQLQHPPRQGEAVDIDDYLYIHC